MYREIGIESDGQLYKMQQDAIRRAREAAASAQLKPPEKEHHNHGTEQGIVIREREKHNIFPIGGFTKLLKNFKGEDLLLLGLLFLLLNEGAEEELILIVVFLFISGFNLKIH